LPSIALPSDELVRNLIRDSSVPLFVFARYLRFPMKSLIVQLGDLLDAFHEAWKFLELGPLVINCAKWALDFDRLFYCFHKHLLHKCLNLVKNTARCFNVVVSKQNASRLSLEFTRFLGLRFCTRLLFQYRS